MSDSLKEAAVGGFVFTMIAFVLVIGAMIMWDERLLLKDWIWRHRRG